MPRYKEYNEKRVLDLAMKTFWKDGFRATSLQMLIEAMKINKFTLYHNFGSKEELLVKTMLHYRKNYSDDLITALRNEPAEEPTLRKFFEQYLLHAKDHRNGCFILSITTETGSSIESVRLVLEDYVNEIEATLYDFTKRIIPFKNDEIIKKKASQLNSLFLSLMLVSSIHPFEYCKNFMEKSISLINLNHSNAQKSEN
jgi:TetR/AcrR family transcriptional regulator, transcriptional repressor for nem operon